VALRKPPRKQRSVLESEQLGDGGVIPTLRGSGFYATSKVGGWRIVCVALNATVAVVARFVSECLDPVLRIDALRTSLIRSSMHRKTRHSRIDRAS